MESNFDAELELARSAPTQISFLRLWAVRVQEWQLLFAERIGVIFRTVGSSLESADSRLMGPSRA